MKRGLNLSLDKFDLSIFDSILIDNTIKLKKSSKIWVNDYDKKVCISSHKENKGYYETEARE